MLQDLEELDQYARSFLLEFELAVERGLCGKELSEVVVLLEQEEIADGGHCAHDLVDDVLDDVVAVMGQFVFSGATVEDAALVFRTHAYVCLQE